MVSEKCMHKISLNVKYVLFIKYKLHKFNELKKIIKTFYCCKHNILLM